MGKQCAVPGCTDPMRPNQLMCRWHWHACPKALQQAVLTTWKGVQDQTGEPEERLARIVKYREAVKAAVDDVVSQESSGIIG